LDYIIIEKVNAQLKAEKERRRLAEIAYHESERVIQAIMNASTDAAFLIDTDGIILALNQMAMRRYGKSGQELLGTNIHAGHPPQLVANRNKYFQQVIDGEVGARFEDERDGMWLDNSIFPIFNEKGEVYRLALFSADITERKLAENSLKESERLFQSAVDNLPEVFIIYDREERIQFINHQAEIIIGRRHEDVIGHRAEELWPIDVNGVFLKTFHEVLRTRSSMVVVAKAPSSFGEITLQAAFNPILDEKGEIFVVLGVFNNLTEQLKAEEELRKSEARYRAVVEDQTELISRLLPDGTITFVNEAYCRFCGKSREELLGQDYLLSIAEKDRPFVQERMALISPEYPLEMHEEPMSHQNGESAWVQWTNRGIFDESGLLLEIQSVGRDVTERKLAEIERHRIETKIEQTQKLESLGVLAGGIAHDFNNLLTSILGYADLTLYELPQMSPSRESLQKIVLAARRAAELTKQMLAYSGHGQFLIEPLYLPQMIKEMGQLLEVSISKKHLLRYDFAPALPYIHGDASQIRQVIMNLIINGSEAIGDKPGAITVRVGARYCDQAFLEKNFLVENPPEGNYVFLEVSDTGSGMTEEVRNRIFEPFYTTKFTGRGLGLAAVLGIVRGHKGMIRVYSEPACGSTFKILFPAAAQPPEIKKVAPEHKYEPGNGTIMVVDDEDSVRELAANMLKTAGYTVITAKDGIEAVATFGKQVEDIQAILLDMTMPMLDGIETFRELRRIKPGVKVILSSGFNEEEATHRFIGKGLSGFLQKPYSMDDLMHAVQKATRA
jgi:two-component system, cell cycle sensor histidine kinase and response regulator CckA